MVQQGAGQVGQGCDVCTVVMCSISFAVMSDAACDCSLLACCLSCLLPLKPLPGCNGMGESVLCAVQAHPGC